MHSRLLFVSTNALPLHKPIHAPLRTAQTPRPRQPTHPAMPLRRPRRLPMASANPPDPSLFDPSTDDTYTEVQPFSITPVAHACALLTLRPLTQPFSGGSAASHAEESSTCGSASPPVEIAFKMSVTAAQVDALRKALLPRKSSPTSAPSPDAPRVRRLRRTRLPADRPSSHDFLKSVVDACGAVVTQAAITHMRDEVFIAAVCLRTASGETRVLDARPSDALIVCARARAPIFLHVSLLRGFHVGVDAVRELAKAGRCELLTVREDVASASALRTVLRKKPLVFRLAVLQMRLDVAVRSQRFLEACVIREEIARVFPVDKLKRELDVAIGEQRFLDAGRLQDQITLWRARLRMWEKGGFDLDALEQGDVESEE